MLNIDSLLLDKFFIENKDFFENARVQKIQQPTRKEIILHIRKNGEQKKFYININPQFYHACFINKENEEKRNIKIPQQPPMFCMLLRKHMEGAKILKLNKPKYERILELFFENYNEIGDKNEYCLSIELMGKHSNVVLYNTDNNIIIGCAHNIGSEKSKERELAGGLPYIYPPKQNKKDLLATKYTQFQTTILKSKDSIKKTLANSFFQISQYTAEEICNQISIDINKPPIDLAEEEIQKVFIFLHEFLSNDDKEFYIEENYESYSAIKKTPIKYQSSNELIDDYFSHNIEKNIVSNLKLILKTKLNKELKKLNNIKDNQEKVIAKQNKTNLYMTKGNLLISNAYMIKKGEKSVTLKNYETSEDITIELDENKSPIENAQRYFTLYNKSKKAIQIAEEMSKQTKQEIGYINQLIFDIDICNKIKELEEIAQEISPQTETTKKSKQNNINVEKREIDNVTVYIGKNNKQNDYLYSKISSPDDLWFHVLNTPSAHVIAKKENMNDKIADTTILKIAQLTKEFSTAKNSTKIPVVYTQRKYIKRPQNTKSGFVVYKNEKEIVVN